MSHAAAAMVRALRGREDARGLLYGQGGYLTKHHAIVLGTRPPDVALLSDDYSVQQVADKRRGLTPPLEMEYTGPATLETHTVLYRKDGPVQHGVVIARTPGGGRLLAKVDAGDEACIAALTDSDRSPIGAPGSISHDADGPQTWRFAS
jgi:hypothetical protein